MVYEAVGRVRVNLSIYKFSRNCFELLVNTLLSLSVPPVLQLEVPHDYLRDRHLHLRSTDLTRHDVETVEHIDRH